MRNEIDRRADETEVRHVELLFCVPVRGNKANEDGQEREGVPHSEHERFEGESASTIKA